jgi:hypothetical protein
MQLFSIEQQKSQPLEAHAAAFSTVKVRAAHASSRSNSCSISTPPQPPQQKQQQQQVQQACVCAPGTRAAEQCVAIILLDM